MPNNRVNWEVGGSHWDRLYEKHNEMENHARRNNMAVGDMVFSYAGKFATTKIYQVNERRVRTRTLATIKTYYPRDCTNTAHYFRLCQVLNYFDPRNTASPITYLPKSLGRYSTKNALVGNRRDFLNSKLSNIDSSSYSTGRTMPIPACKHQSRKLFPLLVARMRVPRTRMLEFTALCALYLDTVAVVQPEELAGPQTIECLLTEIQTELENQGT